MPHDPINDLYEPQHFQEQESVVRYIERQYSELMNRVAPILASGANNKTIERRINTLLREMAGRIEIRVETGIQRSWQISNEKTFAYLDKRLKGTDLPKGLTAVWYDPNEKAMRQFAQRTTDGLKLSDRVWNTVKEVNKTVEAIQAQGIEKGEGAVKIARRLRKELKNPTTQEAPGIGVYKSPVKNTERLARTENNMAYRTADHEAWKGNEIILGYEINLSATQSTKVKARCEICRGLAGKYPVDFKWSGWHP